MNELTLSDLCILVPLIESELDKVHQNIDSTDYRISNDASELSVLYGETASKLKAIYESLWKEGSNYPSYDELVNRRSGIGKKES